MGGFLRGFHQYGPEEMENVAHLVLEVHSSQFRFNTKTNFRRESKNVIIFKSQYLYSA